METKKDIDEPNKKKKKKKTYKTNGNRKKKKQRTRINEKSKKNINRTIFLHQQSEKIERKRDFVFFFLSVCARLIDDGDKNRIQMITGWRFSYRF